MKRLLACVLLCCWGVVAGGCTSARPSAPVADGRVRPATAADASIERQIDALLARMTLADKLGQMSQGNLGGRRELTEDVRAQVRAGRYGSFLNVRTAEMRAELQQIAREKSRLGIPLIFGLDVIHGYRTTFPIPLGQAASWDPALVQQAARIAAQEASAAGIHWTFAPMLDLSRDPRWGRIAESPGEDPYVGRVYAAAMVRGFQGDSLAAADSIAACGKHYVGYGAAEGGRDYNTTWIPEELLREQYLPAFHAAQQAGAATFMSAFNALNGISASANAFTLRQVLRREWGFDGFVVSDAHSIPEIIRHGTAADARGAAEQGILGGVDMEMGSTCYYDNGAVLVDGGQVDLSVIDEAVRNILRVKFRLGLFGDKGRATPGGPAQPSDEALAVARKLAGESLVLLSNRDGALPLSQSIGKVAIIGPLADNADDQRGSWAGARDVPVVTPLAAMREALGEDRVVYAAGLAHPRDENQDDFGAAVAAARGADVVVMFLGEAARMSGEAASRAYLDLPGAQGPLFDAVAATGKPIIVVILAGRPLTFGSIADRASAVLYAWQPGTMGGPAIADALLGKIAPSGKLTVSFPRTVGQVPVYYNHLSTGKPAATTGRAANQRYQSKYIDLGVTPAYPFGYGLSYTKFEYANLRVSAPVVPMGGSVTVTADITNSGSREADEVVQLYIHDVTASRSRPIRELKGFQRVHLEPGQSRSIAFTLKTQNMGFYKGATYVVEPGAFELWIAPDSASGVRGQVEVTERANAMAKP
jgi:beta-glucosidase